MKILHNIKEKIKKLPLIYKLSAYLLYICILVFIFISIDTITSNTKKIHKYTQSNISKTNIEKNLNIKQIYDPLLKNKKLPNNIFNAKSIIVANLQNNEIILEKNSNEKLLIGSLTKLITTKILYDNVNLYDETIITKEAAQYHGSSIEFQPGDKFTNKDLFKAIIIASNNQALYAIKDPNKTITLANKYVQALKLNDTKVSNIAGFDDKNNFSTANDLIHISKIFFSNTELLDISSMKTTNIVEINTNKEITVITTNDLKKLNYDNVIGGKTGTTPLSGQNLVLLVEKKESKYLLIILGSTNRYQDAIKIIDML